MVLLSFDTEEFDVPRESGVPFTLEQGMDVSRFGTGRILEILRQHGVRATFFCTTNFARNAPELMQLILDRGHEVAAHGCDHWQPQPSDVFRSKEILEEITGREVLGYRQPRMFPVSDDDIRKAGYLYNSSLNPCFIPGHYNHMRDPRRPFLRDGVLQIPTAVTPQPSPHGCAYRSSGSLFTIFRSVSTKPLHGALTAPTGILPHISIPGSSSP